MNRASELHLLSRPTLTTRSRPQAWDLDGDGQYDDAGGATASRPFASRGRCTRFACGRHRFARPHGRSDRQRAVTTATAPPPKKISPWPKIRIVGFAGVKRVRVDLLTVRSVRGLRT